MTDAGNKISKAIDDFKKVILWGFSLSDHPDQASRRALDTKPSSGSVHRVLDNAPKEESSSNRVGYLAPVDLLGTRQEFYPKLNAKILILGDDLEINSAVRLFLERSGAELVMARQGAYAQESIAVKFQMNDQQFDFAIVILSADEVALQKKQEDIQNAPLVCSQKTIFELGFILGRMGRNRLAVIYPDLERFKRPTEYFDLQYILFSSQGLWQEQLIRQMKACGLNFEAQENNKV